MAKRKYSFDESKIARFLKEGRGQGFGAEYKPWLTIQDVSSRGRSTRIVSRKTGRVHHFLSDLETSVFFLLDWADEVLDIREQFPLDRDETRRIAAEMGVRHPADTASRVDIVMTTDFLIDLQQENQTVLTARAIKPASDLDQPRTLEKLEIERRYWSEQGVEWRIITELEIPTQRIKNLRWLHEMQSLEHQIEPYAGYWNERCDRFVACFTQGRGMTIKRFLQHLEAAQGFGAGDALVILRYLAANKVIGFDLDAKFDLTQPFETLTLKAVSLTARKRA